MKSIYCFSYFWSGKIEHILFSYSSIEEKHSINIREFCINCNTLDVWILALLSKKPSYNLKKGLKNMDIYIYIYIYIDIDIDIYRYNVHKYISYIFNKSR